MASARAAAESWGDEDVSTPVSAAVRTYVSRSIEFLELTISGDCQIASPTTRQPTTRAVKAPVKDDWEDDEDDSEDEPPTVERNKQIWEDASVKSNPNHSALGLKSLQEYQDPSCYAQRYIIPERNKFNVVHERPSSRSLRPGTQDEDSQTAHSNLPLSYSINSFGR